MTRTPASSFLSSALTVAAAGALVAAMAGCVATAPEPASSSTAQGGIRPLGDGFLGSVTTPTPEATVNPEPGSWAGVVPPAGYRVALITAGADAATRTLATAVTTWAEREGVALTVLTASTDDEVEQRIDEAVGMAPDLVVGAGSRIVDVFTLLTGQHLQQQFLIIGAELPEPTGNTTAVVWKGASFRGTGLSTADELDPDAVTPARARDAITAGVASVLHDLTGIVLRLPS